VSLKILRLIENAGDEDAIGLVERCEGIRHAQGSSRTACRISNVAEDITCKVCWVVVLCACAREGGISCLTEHRMDG
jgi:hypothetical protein